MSVRLLHGDCREVMPTLAESSIDAIVCDPPYGLAFMGRAWDHGVPGAEYWREALRVAKPGAHLLAFGGTRTFHRLAVAVEDAGWEVRDTIAWIYGSGFPKSLDVRKAIDKAAGAERIRMLVPTRSGNVERRGEGTQGSTYGDSHRGFRDESAPATDAAKEWNGWGTALKPAMEPIVLARKPLIGTVAANVQTHGTGALNIDGCRIEGGPIASAGGTRRSGGIMGTSEPLGGWEPAHTGRWPANLIHDGSDDVLGLFPETRAGIARRGNGGGNTFGSNTPKPPLDDIGYSDSGSAARFFYCAKASKRDRGAGNNHPTVKPTDLMRYLVRLVTPAGGTVLDPFMGSGSTGKAALLEGFGFVGIEAESEYIAIAEARLGCRDDL